MLALKKITGARGTLTTLYQTLYTLLFGCLLALYGSTMHPARLCGGFWTIFFCLVCGPLEKKKKNYECWGRHLIERENYPSRPGGAQICTQKYRNAWVGAFINRA